MKKEWVDDVYKRCKEKEVLFFFKQWGYKKFNVDFFDFIIDIKYEFYVKGGCQLDGVIYWEMLVNVQLRQLLYGFLF